jgi:HEAT repeat protein
MTASNAVCERWIDRANLSGRTDLILARERHGFDSMLDVLRESGKGGQPPDPELKVAELEAGLQSSEPSVQYAAAFLAGRCRAAPLENAAISGQLRRLVEDPATAADVAIEAAMSLVLRRERQTGHDRLLRAVANPDPFADAYKAAFFLAELGDASGWPAMVKAMANDIAHFRLMALRHVAGFLPFEGQVVNGAAIDVRARLLAGLADPDPLVRQEMPFYLEEAAVPGLRGVLTPVASGDSDAAVRSAAEIVLGRLAN